MKLTTKTCQKKNSFVFFKVMMSTKYDSGFFYLFIGQLLYDIGLSNLVQIYEKKSIHTIF